MGNRKEIILSEELNEYQIELLEKEPFFKDFVLDSMERYTDEVVSIVKGNVFEFAIWYHENVSNYSKKFSVEELYDIYCGILNENE